MEAHEEPVRAAIMRIVEALALTWMLGASLAKRLFFDA
jgi:hypothetical protein